MPQDIAFFSNEFGIAPIVVTAVVILAALWSLFWKGWALWVAARRGKKIWFVLILLVNTLGILEIVYLFAVAKAHRRSARQEDLLP